MILDGAGYEVATALGAADALGLCDGERFDIALVDVKMPEVNGTTLLQELRRVDPQMGVIVMTAYPDIETAAKVMRHGGRDFVTKPFSESQLLEAVERLCTELGLVYTSEDQLINLIGQRLRECRKRQNMTLKQVSERSGVTASQLSQVEHGRSSASLWSLAKVASALGIRLGDLFKSL